MPKAEHQQSIVALAPKAVQPSADEHGHKLPLDRPLERDVLQPLQPEIQGRIPRPPELSAPAERRSV